MTQTTVLPTLKKLIELQKIDGEIYDHKRELKERPAALEKLKEQFEEKQSTLKALEQEFKQIQVDRNTYEGDLQAKEDAIAKANGDLSKIKTNKEYTAKITEIEGVKADKSLIEERILLSYDKADGVKKKIDNEKKNLAEEEKRFNDAKKEVEDSIKILEDRIKVLESQRSQIAPEVDKAILKKYEKILANKDGVALVPILNGTSCGGCYMNVPPQVVNEIKKHENIIDCEFCARMFYLEEDVENT